ARHAAQGPVPFLLEPNLKDGAGGLRDRSVHRWLAKLFDDVAPRAFDEQAEPIHRIRSRLHEITERHMDVLLFAHQDAIARDLGYEGERPGDALMRDFYRAAREIWWAARGALAVACGEPLAAPDLDGFDGDTPERRHAFVRALRSGSPDVLHDLDRRGVLERLLPEWGTVRCLPQRNVYHRFTVDVHCFETVAEMCALFSDDAEPIASRVWSELADPDRALLAALLHDAGKGSDDDHSARGERIAIAALQRLGFGDAAAAEVGWLVRNHLLLAETASRRDIADQRLVEEVAALIGSIQRLMMLYALTVADARATGPEAWTSWRSALVAELFTKVAHVLERGDVTGAEADEVVRRRTAEARAAVGDDDRDGIASHFDGMTRAYMLAFPAGALGRHFALVREPLGPDEVRMNAIPAGDPGVYEITLAARNRAGLTALFAGVLTVGGTNILSAQVFTRADDVALDVFRVAADPLTFGERRDRILDAAARALTGALDLDREIRARARGYPTVYKGKHEPARVVVDNRASDFATVIEVHATDRVGLLYDIARALADAGLTIDVARIATYGHDVVDAFYVRELDGSKVDGAERTQSIERAVFARVGG
ncbi:MAG: [protein-PII] uridylyltransferase family protein, partial [Actinomycetota bacterium]